MAAINPDIIQAIGTLFPGAPAPLIRLKASKGITNVIRKAGEPAGAWQLTIDGGFSDDVNNVMAWLTSLGDATAVAAGVPGDNTKVEVQTRNAAGALTDLPFTVMVTRPAIGSSAQDFLAPGPLPPPSRP